MAQDSISLKGQKFNSLRQILEHEFGNSNDKPNPVRSGRDKISDLLARNDDRFERQFQHGDFPLNLLELRS